MVKKNKEETPKTPVENTPESTNEEGVEDKDESQKTTTKTKEEKLFNQDQLNDVLTERLAEQKKKLLAETDKKIKEAEAEAERLARLSAEEKQKELDAKKQKENEERERNVAIRENTLTAKEMFQEAGIPTALVVYVVDVDSDKTKENAEQFIKSYSDSVSNTVAEQLKGKPPKDVGTNSKPSEDSVPRAF